MNNLANVEVGDELLVCGRWQRRLSKVIRLTKTQIVTETGRFNRTTGRSVGGGIWDLSWVRFPTDKDREQIHLKMLQNKLMKKLDTLRSQVENMNKEAVTELLEKLN